MGWIGNILCLLGVWQIGRKKRAGFLLSIASCVAWTIEGWSLGAIDLMFIEVALGILSYRNWRLWKMSNEEKKLDGLSGAFRLASEILMHLYDSGVKGDFSMSYEEAEKSVIFCWSGPRLCYFAVPIEELLLPFKSFYPREKAHQILREWSGLLEKPPDRIKAL